jgi:hypothetical protein
MATHVLFILMELFVYRIFLSLIWELLLLYVCYWSYMTLSVWFLYGYIIFLGTSAVLSIFNILTIFKISFNFLLALQLFLIAYFNVEYNRNYDDDQRRQRTYNNDDWCWVKRLYWWARALGWVKVRLLRERLVTYCVLSLILNILLRWSIISWLGVYCCLRSFIALLLCTWNIYTWLIIY